MGEPVPRLRALPSTLLLRVLLVEDSETDAELFCEHLAAHGAAIDVVGHARRLSEALLLLDQVRDIDCVVLDLSLPDAEGLEAVDILTALPRAPAIVVLSGSGDDEVTRGALRRGAEDFLLKSSVDGERIERAIRYAIERRVVKQELVEREQFVRTVLDAFAGNTAVLDRHGVVIAVNDSWRRYAVEAHGTELATGPGSNYLEVCQGVEGGDAALARRAADGIIDVLQQRAESFELDYECSSPTELAWYRMRVTGIPEPQGGALVLHIPITDLKRTQDQLSHLALHDGLTGLPNRQLILDRLGQAAQVTDRRGTTMAVMFIDIDHFKLVNDNLGHSVGDEVLIELARRLRGAVRPGDTVGRLGGDEFVVIGEHLQGEVDAVGLAERVFRAVIDEPIVAAGQSLRLSASIGIALGSDPSLNAERLLQDADMAMYEAKKGGRGRHAVFNERLRNRSRLRLELSHQLADAIDRQEVEVHYQPQVVLGANRQYGMEALARWHRLDGSACAPDVFIEVAETTGLIVPLGELVMDRACRAALRRGPDLQVAVNVSPLQITDDDLVALVARTLERTGLPAARLCVELTETAVMRDLDAATSVLRGLRAMGVQVSLDDFGTGHASLGHLQVLPVDELKIDRSFVAGMGSRVDTRIVTAVTSLANAFGLRVVAEGIETPAQAKALLEVGCTHGQGYLFGRPVALPGA